MTIKYHYTHLIISGNEISPAEFNYDDMPLPVINTDLIANIVVFNYQHLIDNFSVAEFKDCYSSLKKCYEDILHKNINEIDEKTLRGKYCYDLIPENQVVEEAITDALYEVYDDKNLTNLLDYIMYNCDFELFSKQFDEISDKIIQKFGEKVINK